MHILISGSLAYDYIMDFHDLFKNHIMPDKIHMLNVAFVVDKVQKSLGGNSGNIAYTMNLLGGKPLIFASIGMDSVDYFESLKKNNISVKYIYHNDKELTASAYIITDENDNQITAFSPGVTQKEFPLSISEVDEDICCLIVSPSDKNLMIKHAQEGREKGVEVVFDPGQQITSFSAGELKRMIELSDILIGNDYEIQYILNSTKWSMSEVLKQVSFVVITMGKNGSIIKQSKEEIILASCSTSSVIDPTGAGDAYRAGFFTAYALGKDLKTCGQVGSVSATYGVEVAGTQRHCFTKSEFLNRYYQCYGVQEVL